MMKNLQDRMKQGAVYAKTEGGLQASPTKPLHVFIMSPSNWGGTALLSLLASSPESTNLCSANSWACEGQQVLFKHHMIDNRHLFANHTMSDVMKVFEKFWDAEKPVRLEKSPWLMGPEVTPTIAEHFKGRNDVAFVFLTRSACSIERSEWDGHYGILVEHVMKTMNTLKEFPQLQVKYEDIIRDPYGTSERILEFLPALKSLNPNIQSLHQNVSNGLHNYGDYVLVPVDQGERGKPVAQYASEHVGNANKRHTTSQKQHAASKHLGYELKDASKQEVELSCGSVDEAMDAAIMSGYTMVDFHKCFSSQAGRAKVTNIEFEFMKKLGYQ